MQKKMSPSRIASELKKTLDRIEDRVCGFDRLKINVDGHLSKSMESKLTLLLQPHCREVCFISTANQYQPIWTLMIDLFQPNKDALRILRNAIGTRNMSKVIHAEITIDLIAKNRSDAHHIGGYILEHFLFPYLRKPVFIEHDETVYFNSRANKSGTATSRRFVMYADKASKLLANTQESSCCHLEYRLVGAPSCSSMGLNTLMDCVQFDHESFWQRELRLYEIESKKELGLLLAPNDDVSDSSLRSHANAFLEGHEIYGSEAEYYILQSCLQTNPKISKVLKRVDARHILRGIKTDLSEE